jgi:hypothetical protein
MISRQARILSTPSASLHFLAYRYTELTKAFQLGEKSTHDGDDAFLNQVIVDLLVSFIQGQRIFL